MLKLNDMKKSTLTFSEGFKGIAPVPRGPLQMAFDWDKAAKIIKKNLKLHPDLKAEAGLQLDWEYTGGTIFEQGKPVIDDYTYLSSDWAKPTLILSWGGFEQMEIECFTKENDRFGSKSKWDDKSLKILGIKPIKTIHIK